MGRLGVLGRRQLPLAVLVVLLVLADGVWGAVRPTFSDVSKQVGLLRRSKLHLERPTKNKYWGSTVADFNRDGVYDLMMSNHAQNPELYYGRSDKKFRYTDPQLKRHDLHATASADINNDGKLDIFINLGGGNGARVNGVPLTLTRTGGKFAKDVSFGLSNIPARGRSMSFLDIDCDGFLDYVLVNRRNLSATFSHLVYRNNGRGGFQYKNFTGIEQVQAAWFHVIDINNDSKMDLLMMDTSNTELWLGTGNFKFIKKNNILPGLSELRDVRAVAEIDYDNDGDMDIMMVRGSESTQRDDRFYENLGNGKFKDVSVRARIPKGGKHYHVTTGDLNNDGFIDMYISRMTWFERSRVNDLILLNNGDKTFRVASNTNTELARREPRSDGDNANIFDYDMDGRNDILVGSRNTSWYLFRNTTPKSNRHFLTVRVGRPRAAVAQPAWFRRQALGALVKVFCGSKQFMQRVGSQGQSHSQSYMDTLVFGLGTCSYVKRVEIHYPGDVVVTREGIGSADKMVTIGLYNKCPSGKHGLKCNKTLKPCRQSGCGSREVCEVATLVRGKCKDERQQNCGRTSTTSNILKNSGFNVYNSNWARIGKAEYTTDEKFEGALAMRLPYKYSEVRQTVNLQKGKNYRLACKALYGPVLMRVLRGTRQVQQTTKWSEAIRGTPWKQKELLFRASAAGNYKMGVYTPNGFRGVVDDCKLSKNFLFNGDMESGRVWQRTSTAPYVRRGGFGSTRGLKLTAPFSEASQKVNLSKGEKYTLSCKTRGKITLRIDFRGSGVFRNTGPDDPIPGSEWSRTNLNFTVRTTGQYEVKLVTANGISGFVDDCYLVEADEGSTCRTSCLKLNCPL